MEALIKVEALRKCFILSKKQMKISKDGKRVKVAVDDLSFECFGGEIFGLLGPNGAGKTTTMRVLSTLIKADKGDAYVCGASVRSQPNIVREKIAFLTSELKLDEFFTPNYLYDYYSNLRNVPKEVAQARKKALFEKFGIDSFAEVKVGDMSTGMKQKTSLAISLAHDPQVIIYDEPTNGLDVITARVVTDFLMEMKSQGKCIIVSTHIFSLIEKVCDRVAIIFDGKLIALDTLKTMTDGHSLEEVFFELYDDYYKKGDLA